MVLKIIRHGDGEKLVEGLRPTPHYRNNGNEENCFSWDKEFGG
jgi:hypothetical protein